MTGFDWQAYNEGCQKVIEALKQPKKVEPDLPPYEEGDWLC